MAPDSPLYRELSKLRQGPGVERHRLTDYLGPEMRRRCGLEADATPKQAYSAVVAMLRELIVDLPSELQQAAVFAFALERNHRLRTLEMRTNALAVLLKTSPRTARRRMEDALQAMARAADEAVSTPDVAPSGAGWWASSLHSLYRLDTATPELYERRTIVATRQIHEIVVRIGVPDRPDGVDGLVVDALFGARVRAIEPQNGTDKRKVVLELPEPIAAGDQHEFWLRVILPPGQPTWPYYALVPFHPCPEGSVRIRFHPKRLPEEVWLLDEVPYTDLREVPAARRPVTPSRLGDVRHGFRSLLGAHGYGFAWTPRDGHDVSVSEGHVDR